MNPADLVVLADVKAYLGGDLQSNDDVVLSRLITAASVFFTTACARLILQQDYTETYDGKGGRRLYLRNTPVVSIQSLAIDSLAIPPAPAPLEPGWTLSGNVISLEGFWFRRAAANIAVAYSAGWAVPPADVAEAVMELVGLRYRGRDRLGKVSEGMGGLATTSYVQKDVSPFIASVIARYARANFA